MTSEVVSKDELVRAVDYAKGGMYLTSENMESRMTRIARNELFFGRDIPIDEVAAKLDDISPVDIKETAECIFNGGPLSLSAIGPIDQATIMGIAR